MSIDINSPSAALRVRLLRCAIAHTAYHGTPAAWDQPPSASVQAAGDAFPEENHLYCVRWVQCWEKLLEDSVSSAPRRGVVGHPAEAQPLLLSSQFVSGFDPRLAAAKFIQGLFTDLLTGARTNEQVVETLACERLRLGDARNDLHAFFAILAERVGASDERASTRLSVDEELLAFLREPRVRTEPTADEQTLFRQVWRIASGADDDVDTSILHDYSQDELRRRKRAKASERVGEATYPIHMVEWVPQPEQHDAIALAAAITELLRAGVPFNRSGAIRRRWARRALRLGVLVTDPDSAWQGKSFDGGEFERAWIWQAVASDEQRRRRFNELLRAAAGEIEPAVEHPGSAPRENTISYRKQAASASLQDQEFSIEFRDAPEVAVPEVLITFRNADSRRPVRITGRTIARLARMVMEQPNHEHRWTELARAGGRAGHWTSEAKSLTRAGRRISAALPESIRYRWEQNEHSVHWRSE